MKDTRVVLCNGCGLPNRLRLLHPWRPAADSSAQNEVMPKQSCYDHGSEHQKAGSTRIRIQQVCDRKTGRHDQTQNRCQWKQR